MTGIIIGALAGGICFVVFALKRAAYTGGFLIVIVLNKLMKKQTGQLFVRIMIATGIVLFVVSGMAAAMVTGSIVGGVIEYALTKMT